MKHINKIFLATLCGVITLFFIPCTPNRASLQRQLCNCSTKAIRNEFTLDENKASLITRWNTKRLHGLWPIQGISEQDTAGGINPIQAKRYAEIASIVESEVRVVCETGFFRGGSTLFWLMLFPNSVVHSFDTSFPESAVKWFDDNYPGRLITHQGDSKTQITTLQINTCDWVSVDGDHGPEGSYHDIKQFSKVSKPMSVLVSDDTFDCVLTETSCTECGAHCECKGNRPFCNQCSSGFKQAVDEMTIDFLGCSQYGFTGDGKYPVGSCHALFRKPHSK